MRLMQRCSGITGGTSERNELKRGKSKGLNKNLAYEHPFPADLKNTCQTGKKPAWGISAKAALQGTVGEVQRHIQFKIGSVPFADSMTVHPEHIPDVFRGQNALRRSLRHVFPVLEEEETVAESRSEMQVMQDDQDGFAAVFQIIQQIELIW